MVLLESAATETGPVTNVGGCGTTRSRPSAKTVAPVIPDRGVWGGGAEQALEVRLAVDRVQPARARVVLGIRDGVAERQQRLVAVGCVLRRHEPVGEPHLVERCVRGEAEQARELRLPPETADARTGQRRVLEARHHVRAPADARRWRLLARADVAALDGLDQPVAGDVGRHAARLHVGLRRDDLLALHHGGAGLEERAAEVRQRVEGVRSARGPAEARDTRLDPAPPARGSAVAGRAAAVVEDGPQAVDDRQDAPELDAPFVELRALDRREPGQGIAHARLDLLRRGETSASEQHRPGEGPQRHGRNRSSRPSEKLNPAGPPVGSA